MPVHDHYYPDIIPTTHQNNSNGGSGRSLVCLRSKSANHLHKHKNNHSISLDSSLMLSRQESYSNESDIELDEALQNGDVCYPHNHNSHDDHNLPVYPAELDDSPSRHPPTPTADDVHAIATSTSLEHEDEVDGDHGDRSQSQGGPQNNHTHADSYSDAHSSSTPAAAVEHQHQQQQQVSATVELGRRNSSRVTELISRHFPDVPEEEWLTEGTAYDENLCHDIVKELKLMGDNLDGKGHGTNPLQALQGVLNLNVPQLLLPPWLQRGLGPNLVQTALDAALQYSRL